MSLYDATQKVIPIIGTKTGTTRTPVTLTAAYDVADKTKIFKSGGFSKLNLDILYTVGATETSNSVDIRVEGSADGTNFYRLPNEQVSAGISTLTQREFTFVGASTGAYTISIGIDIFYKYTRVSVKESGVVTNYGTVFVEGTLSGK